MTTPRLLDVSIDPKFFEHHFDRYLMTDGARCAGWLVGEHRWMLRKDGVFHITVPLAYEEPPWFRLAIAKLKQRPKFWKVAKVRAKSGPYDLEAPRPDHFVYEIHWTRWKGPRSYGDA